MFQRLVARNLSETRCLSAPVTVQLSLAARGLALLVGAFLSVSFAALPAKAAPYLVIDQDSGAVLASKDATEPWYPASLTKLMTAYVVLDEIRAGRLSPDSLIVVSANAASQAPSKMGFHPGTVLTVDNAMKMLLVKSANDIAVTLAEGIGGSVEGFSGMMNRAAQRLGMADSHFENPNGLPNAAHHSSAQDLGILARALLTEFADHRDYFGIGAISLDGHVFRTFNGLLGRYPGADGMKTGFICAGGFNTVVSASRGGRRLVAVVLGQPSASVRSVVTASLLDKAFAGSSGWASTNIASLTRVGGAPPDMHGEICGRRGKRRAATWEQEADSGSAPCTSQAGSGSNNPALEVLMQQHAAACGGGANGKSASPNTPIAFDPVPVFVGPTAASATAVQPPATLATLAASPAASAKLGGKPGSIPTGTAAFAPSGGSDMDALPGAIKAGGTPVRLHGTGDDKKVGKAQAKSATKTAPSARGAKLAAKTPAAEVKAAAAPVKSKRLATGRRKGKGAAKGTGKGAATTTAQSQGAPAAKGKAKSGQ
ncbi:D-alanyl-D-alanine carboxypeptidase [Rhizobiales bacterium GAS188]|nr:D-alanyl-D-alanine carboxypeptidase [Rhizobiales bacterium GAS188]